MSLFINLLLVNSPPDDTDNQSRLITAEKYSYTNVFSIFNYRFVMYKDVNNCKIIVKFIVITYTEYI